MEALIEYFLITPSPLPIFNPSPSPTAAFCSSRMGMSALQANGGVHVVAEQSTEFRFLQFLCLIWTEKHAVEGLRHLKEAFSVLMFCTPVFIFEELRGKTA